MTNVVVMGSCLTNLASVFLISEYKWKRPTYAGVLRSDYFVEQFLDLKGGVPSRAEIQMLMPWKPEIASEGERWLNECHRDTVGHVATPLEDPGLFETLETQQVDVVLMDNLFDTWSRLLHNRCGAGEVSYGLPFAINRCQNERELSSKFYYGDVLEPADSVRNWVRIIEYVREKQPRAAIRFYCAHACTSTDVPDRYERARAFHRLLAPRAAGIGITVIPPFDLPPELTRMPEDWEHYEWLVYRAMAGETFLAHAATAGRDAGLSL